MKKRKIAYFSPLPPVRSGISEYSEDLLPHLERYFELDIFTAAYESLPRLKDRFSIFPYTQYGKRNEEHGYDITIYQMGNNPHHLYMYDFIFDFPGIVVLHDLVLHHFYVEATLARDLRDEYIGLMAKTYGVAGQKVATARADGIFTEFEYFFFPLFEWIAFHSRGVLVHNDYALSALKAEFPEIHARRVRMGIPPAPLGIGKNFARKELGLPEGSFILGSYGFVTTIKRLHAALKAFARLLKLRPDARLVIIGEFSPGYEIGRVIHDLGVADSVLVTGFLPEETVKLYLAAVDVFLNLRYPTAGETSASLLKLLAAGKPAIISNVRQFRELPDSCCPKVDPGPHEVETLFRYFELFLKEPELLAALSRSGTEYIRQEHGVEDAAREYFEFIEAVLTEKPGRPALKRTLRPWVRTSRTPNRLRAEITGSSIPQQVPSGSTVGVRCRVRNAGDTIWISKPASMGGYVVLGGRIFAERGDHCADLSWETIPQDICPGDVFQKDLYFRVPEKAGRYRVVLDMVDVGITWFAEAGSKPLEFSVDVSEQKERK